LRSPRPPRHPPSPPSPPTSPPHRRDKDGATHREQRGAFATLFKAAGLSASAPKAQRTPIAGAAVASGPTSSGSGGSSGSAAGAGVVEPVPHSPGWWFAGPIDAAALREVAKCLQVRRCCVCALVPAGVGCLAG